jgi:DNA invertase Pin-like site-specific DNA recombinase
MNKNKQNTRTAITYVRSAVHNQDAEASQISAIEKLAESLGCEVTATFIDQDASGANIEHPGLQAMLKYIETVHVDYLLVYDLGRLSRSCFGLRGIMSRVQKASAKVVTVTAGEITQDIATLLEVVSSKKREWLTQRRVHAKAIKRMLMGKGGAC